VANCVEVTEPVQVIQVDTDSYEIITGALGPQGPAGVGVPPGGTTNQVLAKASDADYDTAWVTGGGGGGSGTVTSVSVVTAHGVSGTVANPSTGLPQEKWTRS
jgi:hypothetical protein